MPQGNISVKDLRYLREQAWDRDRWAGVPVLYFAVNEDTSAFDPVTKETENMGFYSHIRLNALVTARSPTQPHATRPTGEQAPGPEVEMECIISYEQLVRAQLEPKSKDLVRISDIFYEVKDAHKENYITNTPFNLDVKLDLKRLEKIPENLDLPFDDEPGLPSAV